MARQRGSTGTAKPRVASPKSTGGGGFVFEDKACAWLMVCMLTGRAPFGAELGKVERLAFQVLPDGWLLDDVLVSTTTHRIALSIRSNAQFRSGPRAPADFVSLAWQQFRQMDPRAFDLERDRLGLLTSKLSSATRLAVDTLTERASRIAPAELRSRVQTKGWVKKAVRTLFESCECPGEVADVEAVDPADLPQLISCLVFPEHDFEAANSESERRAIEACGGALRFADQAAAMSLWETLRCLAADLRPHSGTLTRLELLRRLRPQYLLATYPDHAPDWTRLQEHSEVFSSGVRTSLADSFCLNRSDELARFEAELEKSPYIALVGESGSGKSALARQLFAKRRSHAGTAVWVDASSLDRPDLAAFQRDLDLTFPLRELMPAVGDQEPLLVIDGLDRPLATNSFRLAGHLLDAATGGGATPAWRVVLPCSMLEWQRVQGELRRTGEASVPWIEHTIQPLREVHWSRILEHTPSLTRSLRDPGLRKALENLKLLDVVLRRVSVSGHDSESAENWLHELNIAETFWSSAIDQGPERFARGQFVRELAQLQADRIAWAVPVDSLSNSDGPIASLIADGIVASTGVDALTFQHELYADWARVRILSQQSSGLASFVRTRLQSPLWHRALRLHGAQLIDADRSAGRWRSVLLGFDTDDLVSARDLLIEGAIFSRDPRVALEAIKPELLADEARYLRRLLGRFLIIATLPHPHLDQYSKLLRQAPELLQSEIRVPYWPLWPGLLDFLHSNRAVVTRFAAWRLADVVSLYQRSTSAQHPYREKVADIALCLGEYAIQTQGVHGSDDWYATRRSFYRCLLRAVPERPDAAKPLLLYACQRGPLPPGLLVDMADRQGFARSPTHGLSAEQWPEGPGDHIDESFGEVALDRTSILPLFIERPEVAQEVLLACLIRPRFQQESSTLIMPTEEIRDLHKWFPRSYGHGPFLALLRTNFAHALGIISALVSFATERHRERIEVRVRQLRRAGGHEELNRDPRPEVVVELPDGAHRYYGDEAAYAWSSGGHAPNAVAAALMALEKHFYDQLEAGADISADLNLVLTETNSIAFLKVLCELGKMHLNFFDGVLLPLLGCPELYSFDAAAVDQSEIRLADLLPEFPEPEMSADLQAFRGLEHRKRKLLEVAAQSMLFRPAAAAFFEQTCQRWKTELTNSPSTRTHLLEDALLMLDRANYAQVSEGAYRNVALQARQARQHEDVVEVGQRALLSWFPLSCRRLLDADTVLSQSDCDANWKAWSQIREQWSQTVAIQPAAPDALLSPLVCTHSPNPLIGRNAAVAGGGQRISCGSGTSTPSRAA